MLFTRLEKTKPERLELMTLQNRLADTTEVADYVGLSPAQMKQLRYLGEGPKFVRVTGRQVRYRWEDVDAWIESQTCSRSDQRPARATGTERQAG